MFDWLEFDKSVKKGFEEQAAQLNGYIEKIVEKNAQIRDLPIFEKPGEETVERILSMDIPAKGRDPLSTMCSSRRC